MMTVFSLLLSILHWRILYSTPSPVQTEPTCANTKYSTSSSGFDRRSNKHKLIIAEYNVEFLFLNNASCTGHVLDCPGSSCRWINDSEALIHMEYIGNVINEINADILILIEVEDCCVLDYFVSNYISPTLQYNYYLYRGSDSYTGENIALLTRIDPINNPYRDTRSEFYPSHDSLCNDQSDNGTQSVSKNLIANFSGIENYPDFVLMGIHFLAQPTNSARCTKREAQANIIKDLINEYISNTDYDNFVVLGDFNDYDNDEKDVYNHTAITSVIKIIKESINPNLINTISYLRQNERYTHWPQSSYKNGDSCIFGSYDNSKSYLDEYDYILLSSKLASYFNNISIYHNYCGYYSSDHLPIVVTLETLYNNDSNYISLFGFQTSSISSSGANAQQLVYIKLYWNKYIFQCSLYAPNPDTYYLCDATNTLITNNCEDYDINIESKYEIYIEYSHTNQMFINEIYIEDISNNYYEINSFCLKNDIIYVGHGDANTGNNNNCTQLLNMEYIEYNTICMDDSCTDNIKIEFIGDPDTYQYGIVTENNELLSNGLICTSMPTSQPVTLQPTLYPTTTLSPQLQTMQSLIFSSPNPLITDTTANGNVDSPDFACCNYCGMITFVILCSCLSSF